MSTYQECFTCAKVGYCSKTDVQKILRGFVCPLFAPVTEPIIMARCSMIDQYGPIPAARAMLHRPPDANQEEHVQMTYDAPPAQGTTYADRRKQLEIMSFTEVRLLGNKRYKTADGQPVLDWDESLQIDRKSQSIEKILQFELVNGIIVPDNQQSTQPQGADQMAQQPVPPQFPPNGAPQMPQAFQPPAPGAQPQQMPMPPNAPPMPPQMAPPMQQMAPPPMGPPAFQPPPGFAPQAGPGPMGTPQLPQTEAPAPQAGGKKKRNSGAAAAPPPAPAPGPGTPPQQPNAPMMAPPAGPPAFQPGGFAPPQQGFQQPQQPGFAPPQQQGFAPPQAAPQPAPQAAVDLTPVLQLIDQVGKAVNALGAAEGETLARLERNLQVLTIGVMHIYGSQTQLMQWLSGQNKADAVQDPTKFVEFLSQYLPR